MNIQNSQMTTAYWTKMDRVNPCLMCLDVLLWQKANSRQCGCSLHQLWWCWWWWKAWGILVHQTLHMLNKKKATLLLFSNTQLKENRKSIFPSCSPAVVWSQHDLLTTVGAVEGEYESTVQGLNHKSFCLPTPLTSAPVLHDVISSATGLI